MISVSALFAAVVLTAVAYVAKRVVLAAGAAFAWLILGLWAYSESTAAWDLYYGMFWFGIGMFLAVIVDTIWILIQQQHQETREDIQMDKTEKLDEKLELQKEEFEKLSPQDQLRVKQGLKPSIARAKRENDRKYGWR